MQTHDETIWWMMSDGRMLVGAVPDAGSGCIASGTVREDARSGVIEVIHGEPATLAKLPRGVLDELSARFPGARWWVRDVDEPAPMKIGH